MHVHSTIISERIILPIINIWNGNNNCWKFYRDYQFTVIVTILFASSLVTAGVPEAEPVTGSHLAKNEPDSIIKEGLLLTSVCGCWSYSIFLVDHAWTYRVDHARQQLEQVPGLLARMAALMEVDFHGEVPDVSTVELVMERMWKYNQTYHLNQGVRLTCLEAFSWLYWLDLSVL